jgi:AcrR family transcriptional regulator
MCRLVGAGFVSVESVILVLLLDSTIGRAFSESTTDRAILSTVGPHRERRPRADGERTRKLILDTAVRLATVEGLDGLSIGKLARATEVSKSGVYAHFESKEDLQLATVDTARELFIEQVVVPALATEGLERLGALCRSFLSYVENRTLPGGCFFAAAAAELGGRPGPLRERVAANQHDWMRLLTDAAGEAVRRGELAADTDVDVLAFELNALVIAANTAFILHDDPKIIDRARAAVARVLAAASP